MKPVAALLALLLPCAAHAAKFECPAQIAATSLRVGKTQAGWKPHVSSPLYLNAAAPASGPPPRLGILRGEEVPRADAVWTTRYKLGAAPRGGTWLKCDYGMLGEVSLAKRLPDSVRACTVTGKKGKRAGENQMLIECD